jgi:hypothetical protein
MSERLSQFLDLNHIPKYGTVGGRLLFLVGHPVRA